MVDIEDRKNICEECGKSFIKNWRFEEYLWFYIGEVRRVSMYSLSYYELKFFFEFLIVCVGYVLVCLWLGGCSNFLVNYIVVF